MTGDRPSRPKATALDDRAGSAGRRPGRNTTFEARAHKDEDERIEPQDLMDPEATGASEMSNEEGFFQATAMLDKGELLGELAELDVPSTRAKVGAEPAPKGCRLIVVVGPDIGTEWAFKKPEIVIGRDEDCELFMADIAVSRRHAKISLEQGKFLLTDFGSGNGTFLNGVRIQREDLVSGDEILIGERTFRFVELNEAPPTHAAHPIPNPLPLEPEVGNIPKLGSVGGDNGLGRASQVDARAAPPVDGPSVGAPSRPVVAPAAPDAGAGGPTKSGAALRTTVTAVGAVALLGALIFAAYMGFEHRRAKETAREREAVARREFLQGIELVKMNRFGDALILFHRVLVTRPDHGRAKDYKEHCEHELKVWDAIQEALRLKDQGQTREAIERLEGLDADSAYAPLVERTRREIAEAQSVPKLADARRRFEAGDFDGAMDFVQDVLREAPGFEKARALEAEIAAAIRERDRPRPKPKEEVPPELVRAVNLYKSDQIGAAIDAAEAAGGPNAQTYIARMKRVKQLAAEAVLAHKKKAAAELLRIIPAALEIDQQVAHGEGQVRTELRRYYSDALYLKGIEAYQEQDFVRAYGLLTDALKQNPEHKLSETRLAELSRKARDLYYQGYVLKDSNSAETRKIFRRLTQMTRPDNQFHRLAAKWLQSNGG